MRHELVKLFLENRDAILGFIIALTRDYATAEDVFQEVALAVMDQAAKEPQINNFMPWVREIARRKVGEHYRKSARQNGVERASGSMADIIAQAFAENEVSGEENLLRMSYLRACIGKLSTRSQQLIEAFYGNEKPVRDIAKSISWTEESVRVALTRSRKALAECVRKAAQESN